MSKKASSVAAEDSVSPVLEVSGGQRAERLHARLVLPLASMMLMEESVVPLLQPVEAAVSSLGFPHSAYRHRVTLRRGRTRAQRPGSRQ